MICKAHHYHMNGCTGLVFSKDCQHIFTIGDKNFINCWNWELVVPKSMQSVLYCYFNRFTNHGRTKAKAAGEYLERMLRSLSSQHSQENSALEAMPPVSDDAIGEQSTWLEAARDAVWKLLWKCMGKSNV